MEIIFNKCNENSSVKIANWCNNCSVKVDSDIFHILIKDLDDQPWAGALKQGLKR